MRMRMRTLTKVASILFVMAFALLAFKPAVVEANSEEERDGGIRGLFDYLGMGSEGFDAESVIEGTDIESLMDGMGENPLENIESLMDGMGENPLENIESLMDGMGENPLENIDASSMQKEFISSLAEPVSLSRQPLEEPPELPPEAVIGLLIFALIFLIPVIMAGILGLGVAAIVAILSPIPGILSLVSVVPLAILGAVILGIIGLVMGTLVGLVMGPLIFMLLLGMIAFVLVSLVVSAIIFGLIFLFMLFYGPSLIIHLIVWVVMLLYMAFMWVWISLGGLGPGMIIFGIIFIIGLIIILPISIVLLIIPGFILDSLWLAVAFFIWGAISVIFFILFDLLWSIALPALIIVFDWIAFVGSIGVSLFFLALPGLVVSTIIGAIDIVMGIIWLLFDIFVILPFSLVLYIGTFIIIILSVIFGVPLIILVVAPTIAILVGIFIGTIVGTLAAIFGLMIGPFLGPILGAIALGIIGAIAGLVLGGLSGIAISISLIITIMTFAVMIGIGAWLMMAAYLATVMGYGDIVLSILNAMGGVFQAVFRALSSLGTYILTVLVEVGIPLLRIIDGFLSTLSLYADLAPLFFAIGYIVLALIGAVLGIFIVPLILAVIGIILIFILQIGWNFLYHGMDSIRSFIDLLIKTLEAIKGQLPQKILALGGLG
jgi:hypothetical protein